MDIQPQTIFSSKTGNAGNYRIPAIITTRRGTIIACCDERFYTCSDNPNRIDKVVRRSTDGGVTWSRQMTVVEEHGREREHASAAIDPALLYDEDTDTVFMLYTHTPAGVGILNAKRGIGEYGGMKRLTRQREPVYYLKDGKITVRRKRPTSFTVDEHGDVYLSGVEVGNIYSGTGEFREYPTFYLYLTSSRDDGVTWSKPVLLDGMVKRHDMSFLGAGPGMGLQLRHGEHCGRLIFPVYYNTRGSIPLMLSCALIVSDDHGVTWRRMPTPNLYRKRAFKWTDKMVMPFDCLTESQAVELEDGTIRLFMRNHALARRIATADSIDGGESWQNFRFVPELTHCICQCSAITADWQGKQVVLFLNAADEKKREHGVIRLSYDGGVTFPVSRTLKEGGFVYSSMIQLADGEIAVLYEPSTEHETLEFVKFPIDWILAEK